MMSTSNIFILLGLIVLTQITAVLYFRRVTINRPPVGLYNLKDISFMMLMVILLPLLYVRLPATVVVVIMSLVFTNVLYYTFRVALPRWTALLLAVGIVGADIYLAEGTEVQFASASFIAVNNLLLLLAAIGVCTLYAQAGMRARHVAFFGIALAVYDFIATIALPVMFEFIDRLTTLPMVPIVFWGGEDSVALGLGDILLITLWTVVVYKAYGLRQSLIAGFLGVGAVAAMFFGFQQGILTNMVPAMVVLGPIMAVQYMLWRRQGAERTMAEYEQNGKNGQHDSEESGYLRGVEACLNWLKQPEAAQYNGRFVALAEGKVLGVGEQPGTARKAARQQAPDVTPYVIFVNS